MSLSFKKLLSAEYIYANNADFVVKAENLPFYLNPCNMLFDNRSVLYNNQYNTLSKKSS